MQHLPDHPQHIMPPSPEQVLFFGEFRPKEGGEVDEVCESVFDNSKGRSQVCGTATRQGSFSMSGMISPRDNACCVAEL